MSNHVTDSDVKLSFLHSFMSHDKEKHKTIALNFANVSSRQFENKPIMTFSNFALSYHKDIDHWVIYHLKDVCEMCRRSLKYNAVPCGAVIDVNVNIGK